MLHYIIVYYILHYTIYLIILYDNILYAIINIINISISISIHISINPCELAGQLASQLTSHLPKPARTFEANTSNLEELELQWLNCFLELSNNRITWQQCATSEAQVEGMEARRLHGRRPLHAPMTLLAAL